MQKMLQSQYVGPHHFRTTETDGSQDVPTKEKEADADPDSGLTLLEVL